MEGDGDTRKDMYRSFDGTEWFQLTPKQEAVFNEVRIRCQYWGRMVQPDGTTDLIFYDGESTFVEIFNGIYHWVAPFPEKPEVIWPNEFGEEMARLKLGKEGVLCRNCGQRFIPHVPDRFDEIHPELEGCCSYCSLEIMNGRWPPPK